MKKLISFLFSFLLFVNTAFAFPNEPEGFRTAKWGDTIEKLENSNINLKFGNTLKTISENTNTKQEIYSLYTGELDNKKLSNLDLEDYCFYVFNDNKLIGVILKSVSYKSNSQFKTVKNTFLGKLNILYGKQSVIKPKYESPTSENTTTYVWYGDKSIIVVHIITNSKIGNENFIEVDIFDKHHLHKFLSSTFDQKEAAKEQGW